jgi:hypothetical protein
MLLALWHDKDEACCAPDPVEIPMQDAYQDANSHARPPKGSQDKTETTRKHCKRWQPALWTRRQMQHNISVHAPHRTTSCSLSRALLLHPAPDKQQQQEPQHARATVWQLSTRRSPWSSRQCVLCCWPRYACCHTAVLLSLLTTQQEGCFA